jgi:hypothetical protein
MRLAIEGLLSFFKYWLGDKYRNGVMEPAMVIKISGSSGQALWERIRRDGKNNDDDQ